MSEVGNDVPGAGVDHTTVINLGKRLRKMHRAVGGSFKAFVRALAEVGDSNAKIWLSRKSAAFTAKERNERKGKVRAAQAMTRTTKPVGEKKEKKKKGKGKAKAKAKGK